MCNPDQTSRKELLSDIEELRSDLRAARRVATRLAHEIDHLKWDCPSYSGDDPAVRAGKVRAALRMFWAVATGWPDHVWWMGHRFPGESAPDDQNLPPFDLWDEITLRVEQSSRDECERWLVGALLLDPHLAGECEGVRFESDDMRDIAAAIVVGDVPGDVLVIGDRLAERGQLEDVGGLAALVGLEADCPGTTMTALYRSKLDGP